MAVTYDEQRELVTETGQGLAQSLRRFWSVFTDREFQAAARQHAWGKLKYLEQPQHLAPSLFFLACGTTSGHQVLNGGGAGQKKSVNFSYLRKE